MKREDEIAMFLLVAYLLAIAYAAGLHHGWTNGFYTAVEICRCPQK